MAAEAATIPKPTPVRPVPPPLNTPEGKAALAEREAAAEAARRQLPRWRRALRSTVPWLFLIFLGGIVMQIGLAGAGLMGDDQYWAAGTSDFLDAHVSFVHILEAFPILIILAGFLGADKQAGGAGIAPFLLIGIQYAFIEMDGVARSFHVLNALIIFTLVLLMTLSRIPWRPKYIDAPRAS